MTAQAGTAGLFNPALPPSTQQQIQWAVAAGTGDVITAVYPQTVVALEDGLCLSFRASAANTLVNPTFWPDGLQGYPIVKTNLQALSAADIAGQGHEVMVRFNLANEVWVWVNR